MAARLKQPCLLLLKVRMGNKRVVQLIFAFVVVINLSACATNINYVDIHKDKLIEQKAVENMACQYRLVAVNDKRQDGDKAGLMGLNEFSFSAPEDVVSSQLIKLGMFNAESLVGRDVVVDIKYIYIKTGPSSKIPTVVYDVRVGEQDQFIIRGQAVTIIWVGNEKEAYKSFNAAFQSANSQLIIELNKRCPK